MPDVLIIEDDARIREALSLRLIERGYGVETARAGLPALELVASHDFDLVVLDLGLPDIDGSDALRMIRGLSQVPVLIATARDDETEIVRMLDAGADDYVVKPFSIDHLVARIRAVLRRASDTDRDRVITVGELQINVETREARLRGVDLLLKGKEFDLLAYLAERAGHVVRKRELLSAVWRQPYGGPDKTVDVHLSWLRKKLGESAAEPRYIHTERGVGIRLIDPNA